MSNSNDPLSSFGPYADPRHQEPPRDTSADFFNEIAREHEPHVSVPIPPTSAYYREPPPPVLPTPYRRTSAIKKWMVVLTVAWIPLAVAGYVIAGANNTPRYEYYGYGNAVLLTEDGRPRSFIPMAEIDRYVEECSWHGALYVSVAYAIAMFMLLVFWFAAKE